MCCSSQPKVRVRPTCSYLRITDDGETSSTVIYHRFLPTVIVNGKFSLGTFTAVIE